MACLFDSWALQDGFSFTYELVVTSSFEYNAEETAEKTKIFFEFHTEIESKLKKATNLWPDGYFDLFRPDEAQWYFTDSIGN